MDMQAVEQAQRFLFELSKIAILPFKLRTRCNIVIEKLKLFREAHEDDHK